MLDGYHIKSIVGPNLVMLAHWPFFWVITRN